MDCPTSSVAWGEEQRCSVSAAWWLLSICKFTMRSVWAEPLKNGDVEHVAGQRLMAVGHLRLPRHMKHPSRRTPMLTAAHLLLPWKTTLITSAAPACVNDQPGPVQHWSTVTPCWCGACVGNILPTITTVWHRWMIPLCNELKEKNPEKSQRFQTWSRK